MRDYFTHKITTPEHWKSEYYVSGLLIRHCESISLILLLLVSVLMMPTVYTSGELDYDLVVGADTVVEPSYDPHCANGEISGGCRPVLVVSAEVLRDYTDGPGETEKIANLLINNAKMAPYVIENEAWDCVWNELIVNGKGLKTGQFLMLLFLALQLSQDIMTGSLIMQLTVVLLQRGSITSLPKCLKG